MKDAKKDLLNRREFTSATVMALLSGVAVTISGCSKGGADNPMTPSTPGAGGDRIGSVSDNHGHTATITGAQVSASQAIMLDIRGSSDHPHTVQISAVEMAQIAAGQQVSKATSQDNSGIYGPHGHTVAFN